VLVVRELLRQYTLFAQFVERNAAVLEVHYHAEEDE